MPGRSPARTICAMDIGRGTRLLPRASRRDVSRPRLRRARAGAGRPRRRGNRAARRGMRGARRVRASRGARRDPRRRAARGGGLLGAGEDEVALVESTTQGLNLAALAIPFEPGDNVVIADLEFLQVAIPFVKLAEQGRIAEVRLARNRRRRAAGRGVRRRRSTSGRAPSSSARCSGATATGSTSARCARSAAQAGALLVVDAIQELGALARSTCATRRSTCSSPAATSG